MQPRYTLTPQQVAVLRALNEGIVELSIAEIAVSARLLPNHVRAALGALEKYGLVTSWIPVTGRTGEYLSVLTSDGQTVIRGLAQFKDIPPSGTVVQLPAPFPSFSGWLAGQRSHSLVEITTDD